MEATKNSLKNGIYVFNAGQPYTPEEWGKKPADGVLLIAQHTNIIIDPLDLQDGKEMTWDEAMNKVKQADKTLPDRHEVIEITSRLDEVNKVLRQIGGQEISGWYWTREEYSATYAWYFYSYGYMYANGKANSSNVRPVTAFLNYV